VRHGVCKGALALLARHTPRHTAPATETRFVRLREETRPMRLNYTYFYTSIQRVAAGMVPAAGMEVHCGALERVAQAGPAAQAS